MEGEFSPKALSPPLIPTPSVTEISLEHVEEAANPTKVAATALSLPTPEELYSEECRK